MFSRNALDRDRLLDRLWLAVEPAPHLAQLVAAEREDLLKGDIPPVYPLAQTPGISGQVQDSGFLIFWINQVWHRYSTACGN